MTEKETARAEPGYGQVVCPECGGCGMVMRFSPEDCTNCYQGKVPAPENAAEADQ